MLERTLNGEIIFLNPEELETIRVLSDELEHAIVLVSPANRKKITNDEWAYAVVDQGYVQEIYIYPDYTIDAPFFNYKEISQSIPKFPKNIRNLSHITKIVVFSDKIEELPPWIGDLKYLTTLCLNGCSDLKTLPESLGNLINLKSLELKSTNITQLPESIGNLTDLTELNITWCKILEKIPYSIGYLTKITTLDFFGCERLDEVPESIGQMTQITNLRLPTNIKKIPTSIGQLNHLTKLQFYSFRQLTKLPDSIGSLIKLTSLDCYNCKQLEELPETLGQLGNLTELNLEGCESLKTLPDSISFCPLRILNLKNCLKLGSLTDSIGQLKYLIELDLTDCVSLCILPNSMGNLTHLTKLSIRSNSLLNQLPESFRQLTSLKEFDLSNCGFHTIPTMLHFLSDQLIINFAGNPWESEEEKLMVKNTFPIIRNYLRKKATIKIFLSYSVRELHFLRLEELIEFLEKQPEIYEVTYCEEDLHGNIDEFMETYVKKSQLVLFVATRKTLFDSKQGCEVEIRWAVAEGIPIIPLIGPDITWEMFEQSEMGQIIGRELGMKLDLAEFKQFCSNLYEYIKNYKAKVNLFDKTASKIDRMCLKLIGLMTDFIGTPISKEIIVRRSTELELLIKDLSKTDKAICQQIGKKVVDLLAQGPPKADFVHELEAEIDKYKKEIQQLREENSLLKIKKS